MSHPIVFVDCETTGLDPTRHEAWEIATIAGMTDDDYFDEGVDYVKPLHLSQADPTGLQIGRFYERRPKEWDDPWEVAEFLAKRFDSALFVGSVPDFDARFLRKLLLLYDQCPTWHYHLIDVEVLAAGKLGLRPPWDSELIGEKLGLTLDPALRHTALGDARWAKSVYEAVLS